MADLDLSENMVMKAISKLERKLELIERRLIEVEKAERADIDSLIQPLSERLVKLENRKEQDVNVLIAPLLQRLSKLEQTNSEREDVTSNVEDEVRKLVTKDFVKDLYKN